MIYIIKVDRRACGTTCLQWNCVTFLMLDYFSTAKRFFPYSNRTPAEILLKNTVFNLSQRVNLKKMRWNTVFVPFCDSFPPKIAKSKEYQHDWLTIKVFLIFQSSSVLITS